MIIIGKPVNGISLNGNEYLLNEKGQLIKFDDTDKAKQFLKDNGYDHLTDEEMEDSFSFEEEIETK